MGTGFLSVGKCHVSNLIAQDAYYSALIPFSYFDSSLNKLVSISYQSSVSGSWNKLVKTGNTTVTTVAPVVPFPVCSSSSDLFLEGVNFGWSVVGVLALAWAFAVSARVLKGL